MKALSTMAFTDLYQHLCLQFYSCVIY